MIEELKLEILKYASDENKEKCEYFHKTSIGSYAEGDVFLGISVSDIRSVAKKHFNNIKLDEINILLESKYHEFRILALVILVFKYKSANDNIKKDIVDFYILNAKKINGWDLVDLSAPYILGDFVLKNKEQKHILYSLSLSSNIWEQRIAVVSNITLIKTKDFEFILKISETLLLTEHDLIQKAVGWMLREVGKKDYMVEYNFLKKRYKEMPRTMLRYSIEKFDESVRQKFLKGEI